VTICEAYTLVDAQQFTQADVPIGTPLTLGIRHMKFAAPTVRASVTLLPEVNAPKFVSSGKYRPHIVLGPITQRTAIMEGRTLVETYIGVAFVGGPEKLHPGETAEVELALMYYPHSIYDGVKNGATFTVREGATIVGYGKVIA
jgi:hypothetical protein